MDDSVMLAAGWVLALASHARSLRARVMLAHVAHEIRGPLCAAGLALAAERLDAVERELQRAGLAVADLDGPRRARRAPFDAVELLRAFEGSWRSVAEAHGARLAVTTPHEAWLRGDPDRLVQAVANLVANAAEHGGAEVIRVGIETDGAQVRVLVADDGGGLPEGVAVRLGGGGRRSLGDAAGPALLRRATSVIALASRRWSGVHRGFALDGLDRSRRHDPRRGHGLAIVATIARLHGGRLSHRRSAAGSVLVLELPVTGASRRMARVRTAAPGLSRRPLREALS